MSNKFINDVIERTSGELYLGVVGSVRSGKSTFIRNFMMKRVIPLIEDEDVLLKVKDELPLSSAGKRIMTVEPKFIPSDQMTVYLEDNIPLKVRLIDSVGYVLPNSLGSTNDDGSIRLIKTPWFSEEIPFDEAAKLGTKKVIDDHCHIGIVVTSDGSFGDFSREEYSSVEEEIIQDLKNAGKPFIIVLNTAKPNSDETINLKEQLKDKYNVSVIAIDLENLTTQDTEDILKTILDEFDIEQLNVDYPKFMDLLTEDTPSKSNFLETLDLLSQDVRKMKDVYKIKDRLISSNLFSSVELKKVDAGRGIIDVDTKIDDEKVKQIICEITGEEVTDLESLIILLQNYKLYKEFKEKYENKSTYLNLDTGFVIPSFEEMTLNEPVLIKQGSKYGIKLSAKAPVKHLCELSIDSSFEPIIGEEMQAKMLLQHMVDDYNKDPNLIWNSLFFGQKLSDLICDGVKVKVNEVANEVENKYIDSLEKIVNKGKGGVISIVL